MKKIVLTLSILSTTSCNRMFYSSVMHYQNQQCFDIANAEDRATCFANASKSYMSYINDSGTLSAQD